MKNLHGIVSAFALGCLGMLALGGCAAPTDGPEAAGAPSADAPDEKTSTSESALVSGGGSLGFNCDPYLGCICNGDWDCNNMFGSGVCDGRKAQCWTRGPAQYCICGGPFVPKAAVGAAPGTTTGGAAVLAP
jgi:hypothetical protein